MKINFVLATSTDEVKSIEAQVGQRVTLPCSTTYSTSPIWTYREFSLTDRQHRDIVLNGRVVNGNAKWFELERPSSSEYNLAVRAASLNNTGFYSCQEDDGFGQQHHFYLTVRSRLHF